MKRSLNMKTSLLSESEKQLNRQLQMEAESSMFYLSCGSWCEYKGYINSANFLYGHSEEEKMHMMKIFKYINDSGGHALAPEIKGIKHNFDNLRQIFELVLEHEIEVSNAINKVADSCFQLKDFTSFNFLQWFIAEQREEEEISRRALELFDIIGTEGQGLWMIEQELVNLSKRNVTQDDADKSNMDV